MRRWFATIRDWFRRGQLDRELTDELRFHQRHLERDARADGYGDDSPREAHLRLGNMTAVREAARDTWSVAWLDHLQQDIRYAMRGLRRAPGFTVTVILTLGLGIGANAAMFGVIDRLMLRPFPLLHDPATVNRVYLQTNVNGKAATRTQYEYTRFLDLRRTTTSFSQYAAFAEWRLAIGEGESASERQVAGVNASFFAFFDARPVLGRFFGATEDSTPRGADVGVLSYAFWQTAFGGKNVLGKTLQVGPLLVTVVGVAPNGFTGVSEGEPPAIFLPITALAYGVNQGDAQTFYTRYSWTWMSMMVRRKPGVTLEQATADLTHAFVQSRDAQRATNPRVLPTSVANPRAIAGALKAAAGPGAGLESLTLLWVSGVAVIVFLIACANVANLMVARVLRRNREVAVRLALGVSRRLAGQFLIEGLVLALLGCAAGVAMAQWMSAALRAMLIGDGQSGGLAMDWRTIAVASGVALVAAVVTSMGPAALPMPADLAATLRPGSRGSGAHRSKLRALLLAVQGALSVILLVGAGLFVRSLINVDSMPLGWTPEPVLVVSPNYRGLHIEPSAMDVFRRRLLETARAIPGVESARQRVNSMPFATNMFSLHVPGVDSVERLGRFNYQATTPEYFATVGTKILRGRAFNHQDGPNAPLVTVVSETMARVLWPGEQAIGKCIRVGADTAPCTTVVGIAQDVVQQSVSADDRLMYYLSDEQPPFRPANRIFVRMSQPDAALQVEAVRSALQAVMPAPAYVTVAPLENVVDVQRRSWKLGALMFVAFGALALIVAAVGLYGVIAYDVAQRMHELGIRVALGARPRNIIRLVMMQGMSVAAVGVAAGIGAALFAGRWIQPLLFRESATDPVVFGGVALTIGLTALLASAAPAWRATRADPNTTLRSE